MTGPAPFTDEELAQLELRHAGHYACYEIRLIAALRASQAEAFELRVENHELKSEPASVSGAR